MTVSRILTYRKKEKKNRNEKRTVQNWQFLCKNAPILLCFVFFFHIAGSLSRKQTNSAMILKLLRHQTHRCRQHRICKELLIKKNWVKMCGYGEARELRFHFGPAEKQGKGCNRLVWLKKELPAVYILHVLISWWSKWCLFYINLHYFVSGVQKTNELFVKNINIALLIDSMSGPITNRQNTQCMSHVFNRSIQKFR